MGRIDLELTEKGHAAAKGLEIRGGADPPEELDIQLPFLELTLPELAAGEGGWTILHEALLFASGNRMGAPVAYTDTREPFEAIVDALWRYVSVHFPGAPKWVFEDIVLWMWHHDVAMGSENLTPTLLLMSTCETLAVVTNEWRLGFIGQLLELPGQTTEDLRGWSDLALPTVNWHLRQLVDIGALVEEDSRPIFYYVTLEFMRSLAWRIMLALELAQSV